MTKFITAIVVAAGILIMPNVAKAAGTFSNAQAINETGQIIQIKETRRHNRGRARHNRHNRRHNRHVGGRFFFDHDLHGDNPYHSCRSLKRKAYYTGTRYWWNKYRRCMSNRY